MRLAFYIGHDAILSKQFHLYFRVSKDSNCYGVQESRTWSLLFSISLVIILAVPFVFEQDRLTRVKLIGAELL